MPRTVNIHEAKTHLSRLLEEVRNGETVIIAKAGEPIAELTAVRRTGVDLGFLAGQLVYDDEEFVAADEEIQAMFDEEF